MIYRSGKTKEGEPGGSSESFLGSQLRKFLIFRKKVVQYLALADVFQKALFVFVLTGALELYFPRQEIIFGHPAGKHDLLAELEVLWFTLQEDNFLLLTFLITKVKAKVVGVLDRVVLHRFIFDQLANNLNFTAGFSRLLGGIKIYVGTYLANYLSKDDHGQYDHDCGNDVGLFHIKSALRWCG